MNTASPVKRRLANEHERQMLQALNAEEQEQLAGLLGTLLSALEREQPYPPPRSTRRGPE